MAVTDNPFEVAALMDGLHVEVLTDAVLADDGKFGEELFGPIKAISSNEERITTLELLKGPFLFSSAQLMELCELTTSLKTRLEFIKTLGPRLVDPTAKTAEFTGMFRFNEEKAQVEQVLKSRSSALGITQLTNTRRSSHILSSRGGRGGRGGSRRESLGEGQSPSSSMANVFSSFGTKSEGDAANASSEIDAAVAAVEKCDIKD
eukprot:gene9954-11670_t